MVKNRPPDIANLLIMKILLVEDDAMIGRAVKQGLTAERFTVDWVQDGVAAELAMTNGGYDLVVLDLGLPRKDGLQLLTSARTRGDRTPVLIVTARDAVADRITGLNAGADDYVVKPFDLDELVARIRALIRRSAGVASTVQSLGSLTIDTVMKTVRICGELVDLSAKEFGIVETLMRQPGAVVSKEALEESLYGWGQEIASNAVEVHLHFLRKKLGSEVIKNVRGVGYRISEG